MKILKYLAYAIIAMILLGVVGLYGVYRWADSDLPNFTKITDYSPPLVTTVYANDGQVMGYFYKEKRFLVRLEEMSKWLPMAFLAAEDSAFYDHEGVDLMAIVRAFVINLKSGSIRQGGSTITQQIVKQLLLTSEKSYERKIKEALLAYRLEHYLTKEEILTIYLNHIFLGAKSYGVEAASRAYFGKHAKDVTLAECAILAGLPQAPSRFNPYKNPSSAKERQRYVLGEMLELGWITPEQYTEALEQEIVYQEMDDPSWGMGAYYLEEVRRWLIDKYGEDAVYEQGMSVHTACDLKHQVAAEKALRDGLVASAKRRGWAGPLGNVEEDGTLLDLLDGQDYSDEKLAEGEWVRVMVTEVSKTRAKVKFGPYEGTIAVKTMAWCREPNPNLAPDYVQDVTDATRVVKKGDVVWASIVSAPPEGKTVWTLALEIEPKVQGALVSLDPRDGQVKTIVGGYDYLKSEFNRATQAKRQPGSAFKPIVYSAAMDHGFTPASIVMDAPIVFENMDEGTLWRPENYENIFYGPTLLREALVRSRNLVTVRVAMKIGVSTIIERAKALGLDADFPYDLSVALGSASVTPMNLCQAYTAFANGGAYVDPRLVLKVDDVWGKEIFVSEPENHEAISPQTAFIMATLMKDVVQYGTGFRARILGRPLAGKTGTTNEERDAWFMGYSPYLVTGVFVGFDEPKPMGRLETGSRAASPIWVAYRKEVEEEYPVQDFPQPEGVVIVRVDAESGKLAGAFSAESLFLPFKTGTQPTAMATGSPGQDGQTGSEEDLFKQDF